MQDPLPRSPSSSAREWIEIARLPLLVRRRDRDLERDRALLGEDQRRLQGQLLDRLGADLLAGLQRQLEEGGAGQDHGAGTAWSASQGWVARERRPVSSEALALGVLDRGAEQRVLGVAEPGRAERRPRRRQPSSQ